MSLTAASAGLVAAASAAEPREGSGPPTTGLVYLVTYRPGAKWIETVAADPAVISQVFTHELHRWNWVDWAQALERAAPATR